MVEQTKRMTMLRCPSPSVDRQILERQSMSLHFGTAAVVCQGFAPRCMTLCDEGCALLMLASPHLALHFVGEGASNTDEALTAGLRKPPCSRQCRDSKRKATVRTGSQHSVTIFLLGLHRPSAAGRHSDSNISHATPF